MPLALPFERGQLVVLVLNGPRERWFGRLLGLEAAGVALRGFELSPWEEVLALVRQGEEDQVALATRFVPMHRVESLYLDEPSSGVPSLGQVFRERTGQDVDTFLQDPSPSSPS
jgi:hypothetical protein